MWAVRPARTCSSAFPASPWSDSGCACAPRTRPGCSRAGASAKFWAEPSHASTWARCFRPATALARSTRSLRPWESARAVLSRPSPCCGPAASSRRATPTRSPTRNRPRSWPACCRAWASPRASTTPGRTPPVAWRPPAWRFWGMPRSPTTSSAPCRPRWRPGPPLSSPATPSPSLLRPLRQPRPVTPAARSIAAGSSASPCCAYGPSTTRSRSDRTSTRASRPVRSAPPPASPTRGRCRGRTAGTSPSVWRPGLWPHSSPAPP